MPETKADIIVNRKYKDRLFRLRFGSAEYKEDVLSLYNALNGTAHNNADDITITTIDDAIYIRMKNDVSLLLDGNMSLWEQQSSINPNMPVRGLLYFGNLYNQYIKNNKLNIYGKKLQRIPTPQYIVFYNGAEELAPISKLRLSDAFINPTDNNDFEWTAKVYNLNKGKNEDLLKNCRPLYEYMELVNRIRDNQKSGMDIKEAVNTAVDSCISAGIMTAFLSKHKAEVMNVCITEFDEEIYTEGIREEGREEGLDLGLKALVCSLKDFLPDFEAVYQAVIKNQEYSGVSTEQVKKYY
ncbi:MAG: hypothetical protein NC337_00200 [Roseburia sp.]|nr:hypothetical protein [Roseburia sp.]